MWTLASSLPDPTQTELDEPGSSGGLPGGPSAVGDQDDVPINARQHASEFDG
jgi:hypothetical protein